MTVDVLPSFDARLCAIEALLAQIMGLLSGPKAARQWYTVEEVAALVDKRPYTVREWCRHGRINAMKRTEKRGGAELWSISADEVERYMNEGLMPADVSRNATQSRNS